MACIYATDENKRGTAPISYVHSLRGRIICLERILRQHNILIADTSSAQLLPPACSNALVSHPIPAIGSSASTVDQLCSDFEGILCLDEGINFESGGEARYFWRTSARLNFLAVADVRSDSADANTAGRVFLEVAEVLLRSDIKHPSITTVQSLAILGIANIAFGHEAAGWLHEGMSVRMSLDMGLHLDPRVVMGSHRMDNAEAELRRKIYWALYCNDKLSASYTGRGCSMLSFQGAVSLPSTAAGLAVDSNSDVPPSGVDQTLLLRLQHALCMLTQILEQVLLTL
ncbi:fungal-specific transcription factor domain-containing protein [Aspergillus recurvatus]